MSKQVVVALLLLLAGCSPPHPDAFGQARRAYLAGQDRRANALFRGCVARRERLPESLYYRGCCLAALDSLPQAIVALNASLKASQEARSLHVGPGTLVLSPPDSSDNAFTAAITEQLGHAHYRLGHYTKAFNAFFLSQLLNPRSKTMRYNLGVTLLSQDKYHRAANFLLRHYQAGHADAQACTALADAYRLQHQFDSARIFLGKALQLQPAYPLALAAQRELDSLTRPPGRR